MKRNTPIEQDLHDNLDYQEGLVFTSEYENTIWEGMESTFDFEATRIPQLKTKLKDWLAK